MEESTPYRDDRETLRQRVTELEREVSQLKDPARRAKRTAVFIGVLGFLVVGGLTTFRWLVNRGDDLGVRLLLVLFPTWLAIAVWAVLRTVR